MGTWLVILLAFLGVFLAVIAANAVLVELASGERRRMKEEMQEFLRQRVRVQVRAEHDLEELMARTGPAKAGIRARLATLIAQSGVKTTIKQLLGYAALIAALSGGFVFFMFHFEQARSSGGHEGLFDFILRIAFQVLFCIGVPGSAGMLTPVLYLLYVRKTRQDKILSQLPDAFELMGRVLRAGQTINYALQIVADQGSPPLSLEFFRCNEQMNLGMEPESALRELAQRTGVLEMRIFAVAILVQRQTGGNLSVLFDKMGAMVRERFRINGMIKSLTAQGRLQALILTALPIAMFAWLMYSQPSYERELFNYPIMCVMAVGFLVTGTLWIRRVVNFDY